jgi:hypothetical protein
MESRRLRRPRRRAAVAPAPAPTNGGTQEALALTLRRLEELVTAAAATHAERAEEWRWYLDYLRQNIADDEPIPREYRLLVSLVFGKLPQVTRALDAL